jgi:hypothetical protein
MSVHMRRFTVSGTALAFALTAVGVGPAAHADVPALSLRPAVTSPVPAAPSAATPYTAYKQVVLRQGSSVPAVDVASVAWTYGAAEKGSFAVAGNTTVRYGANSTYVQKVLTGPVACNNATFGDPLKGTVKHCDYEATGWTYGAAENGSFSAPANSTVRYGANGTYTSKTLSGTVSCSNANFGDPLIGTAKHCDFQAARLIISGISVSAVTQTGATISWSVSQYATGQVEYGLTTSYGGFTAKESSFNYNHHVQTISGLAPGTIYHFAAMSTDQAGASAVSPDAMFTTLPNGSPSPTPIPTPPAGIAVPPSIDATGATDVSAALNAWVASVANGSTLLFPAGAIYRLSQGIQIANRSNLTFEGNGATLKVDPAALGTNQLASAFILGHQYGGFWGGTNTNIAIRDFTLVGNSTTPGIFVPGQEGESALELVSTNGLQVTGITASAFPSDFAFVEADTNVHMWANTITSTGRNALSVISGSNIEFDHTTMTKIGYVIYDIEPNDATEAVSFVNIHNNSSGSWSDAFFAVDGSQTGAAIHDITVANNISSGRSLFSSVNGGGVAREQNIILTGNVSNTATSGPVLLFKDIDGLTVQYNSQPLSSGAQVSATNCTGAVITPNP